MRYRLAAVATLVLVVLGAVPADAADPVTVVVANDIQNGTTPSSLVMATSAWAVKDAPDLTLLAGDIAKDGKLAEYRGSYAPSWGRLSPTLAAPGNHDYHVAGAADFKTYFGYSTTYRSTNIGRWHIVLMDTSIAMNAGSAQNTWLKNDLAANSGRPVLGIMHACRYCTHYSDNARVQPLYDLLAAAKADLVVNGHEHIYQRMVPVNGIVQITDGPSGKPPRSPSTPDSHVAKIVYATGYMRLFLSDNAYVAEFVDSKGVVRDRYSQVTHN